MLKDRTKFVEDLNLFLNSKERISLITGLDDDMKIKVTILCLNKRYKEGTICVSTIGKMPDILNSAFIDKVKLFPTPIIKNNSYKILDLKIKFEKYLDRTSKRRNINTARSSLLNNGKFSVYYPVSDALMNDKNFKLLTDHIKNNQDEKIMIITADDQMKDTSKLHYLIDSHIHYESKNDNPEIHANIKSFLNKKYNRYKANKIYSSMLD